MSIFLLFCRYYEMIYKIILNKYIMAGWETPCYEESHEQGNYEEALGNLTPEELARVEKIRRILIENSNCENSDPENTIDPADLLEWIEPKVNEKDIAQLAIALYEWTINESDIIIGDVNHTIIQSAMIEFPDSAATKSLLAALK